MGKNQNFMYSFRKRRGSDNVEMPQNAAYPTLIFVLRVRFL